MHKIQQLIALVFTVSLVGCGGGGGADTGPAQPPVKETPIVKISGAVVKGPLAATAVSVFRLERGKTDAKSEVLNSTNTDGKGQFQALQLTDPQAEFYLLEAVASASSTDLLVNQPTYADQLSGVFSLSQLKSGPVYLTPLSQLVALQLQLTLQAGNSTGLPELYQQATQRTSQLFGFNQLQAGQIHTVPALFIAGTDKTQIYKFRRVNETLGALAYRLMQHGQIKYSQAMLTLAEDALDGVLDATVNGKPLSLAAKLPDYKKLVLGAMVNQLAIPLSDQDLNPATNDPVTITNLAVLLLKEAGLTGHSLTQADLEPLSTLKLPPLSRDTDGDEIPDVTDPDDDNDKIPDEADMFPLDPTESTDTDKDGIGDNKDAFATDSACWRKGDGDSKGCYLRQVADLPQQHFQVDHANQLLVTDLAGNRLLRMDLATQQFKTPIQLAASQQLKAALYQPTHQLTYLLLADGDILTLDGAADEAKPWVKLQQEGSNLHNAGNYLLVQTGGYYSGQLHSLNKAGQVLAKFGTSLSTHTYFDPTSSRLYHLLDYISPSDLAYHVVNQTDGKFSHGGETPYHGAFSIMPPIRVSADGKNVLLGSGDIYQAPDLIHVNSLGRQIIDAQYLPDGQLITFTNLGSNPQRSSMLLRQSSDGKQLEVLPVSGAAKALLKSKNGFVVLSSAASVLQVLQYQPSDDTDRDGVNNSDDDFPLDKAAAKDTDQDGAPDSWNPGMTAADSSTGLTLDAFPQDSACQRVDQGSNGRCDPDKAVPNFIATQLEQDVTGVIYSLSPEHRQVFRWSAKTQSYLNPLFVGRFAGFGQETPVQMSVNATQQRLYLVYQNGRITYIDLTNGKEQYFAGIAAGGYIAVIGQYLLGQDATGAWSSHHIFDKNGVKTATRDWNHQSAKIAWNEKLGRLFYLSNHSPQDILYEDIGLDGKIKGSGETPYHGDYHFGGHLFVAADASELLTGAGQLFDPNSLKFVKSIAIPTGSSIIQAYWLQKQLVAATDRHLYFFDQGTHRLRLRFAYDHPIVGMFQLADLLVVALNTPAGQVYQTVTMADQDQDGLPGWWEQYYGLNNNNAADALTDLDQDGLNNLEEFQQTTDPTRADTDQDGLSDGAEVKTHGTKVLVADTDGDGLLDGAEIKEHKTNPLASDTDNDGLSDRAEVQQHQTDPLSADTDKDGLPDLWEVQQQTNPKVSDASDDADKDGLTHLQEYAAGTQPFVADTDGDALNDGHELLVLRTNPLKSDSDDDKIPDGWEAQYGFNPLSKSDALLDADLDQFSNLEEYYFSTEPDNSGSYPLASAWSSELGDSARRAYQPMRLNTSHFRQKWQVSLQTENGAFSGFAVAGNTVVLTRRHGYNAGEILALYAVSGAVRWQKQLTGSQLMFVGAPTIADNDLYIQTGGHSDAFVRGYELTTGDLRFKSSYGNQWSGYGAPAVDKDNVYIAGGYYGGAAAFKRSNGDPLWATGLVQVDGWGPALTDKYMLAYPGAGRGKLSLLAKGNGNIVKTFATDEDSYYGQSSVYPQLGYRNDAYLLEAGQLKRLDLQTGKVTFAVTVNNPMPALAVTPTELVVVKEGIVSVFDDTTGALLWSWEASNGQPLTTNPVVSSQFIFVATTNMTYAIDRSSRDVAWSVPIGGKLALDGAGTLYVLSEQTLTAFSLKDSEAP